VYLTKTYSLYEEVNGIEKYALDFLTDYYEKKIRTAHEHCAGETIQLMWHGLDWFIKL